MIKTQINLMACEKIKDDFMHKFDVFEPFKRLNENMCIECELANVQPNLAFLTLMKQKIEENGKLVTAIWIAKEPEIHIVDWSIKVVSNGRHYMFLDDYLKQFKILRPSNR